VVLGLKVQLASCDLQAADGLHVVGKSVASGPFLDACKIPSAQKTKGFEFVTTLSGI